MLLKDQLYQITHSEKSEDAAIHTLRISETHPLFKGHFPETPVLPGVCILQIFKELAEMELAAESPLFYREIKQCKFLLPVVMNNPAEVQASIKLTEDNLGWNLTATLKNEESVFTTLKAVLAVK